MRFLLHTFLRVAQDIKKNIVVLGIIVMYLLLAQFIFHSVCPFAILTGIPCPACGLTRAGLCLLTGQFQMAWELNPCIYLIVPYLLYLGFFRYAMEKKAPLVTCISILVGIVTIAVYLLRFINGTSVNLLTPGILPIG